MKQIVAPLRVILLVMAIVLFALAGLGVPEAPRFKFIGWGLFFWALSTLTVE